ncbi:MAG: hypothetical protein ACPGTS_00200 [Minisyncoccia bacterium]
MKILKRIFKTQEKEISKLTPDLSRLEIELKAILEEPNAIKALYDLTKLKHWAKGKPFENSFEKMTSQEKNLRELQENLSFIGAFDDRNESCPVSTDNIYLGNIYGIWTFSLSYILARREKLEKDMHDGFKTPKSVWSIFSDQAVTQINPKKIEKNISLIREIKSAA